jgi:hypothetical protein
VESYRFIHSNIWIYFIFISTKRLFFYIIYLNSSKQIVKLTKLTPEFKERRFLLFFIYTLLIKKYWNKDKEIFILWKHQKKIHSSKCSDIYTLWKKSLKNSGYLRFLLLKNNKNNYVYFKNIFLTYPICDLFEDYAIFFQSG